MADPFKVALIQVPGIGTEPELQDLKEHLVNQSVWVEKTRVSVVGEQGTPQSILGVILLVLATPGGQKFAEKAGEAVVVTVEKLADGLIGWFKSQSKDRTVVVRVGAKEVTVTGNDMDRENVIKQLKVLV